MRQERNLAHLQIRLPQRLDDDINIVAASLKTSRAELMRQWLRLLVDLHRPDSHGVGLPPVNWEAMEWYIDHHYPSTTVRMITDRISEVDQAIEGLEAERASLGVLNDAITRAISEVLGETKNDRDARPIRYRSSCKGAD